MSTRPRNQELPILDELGHDLATAFRREERADAARRNRRRMRRVAIATASLFVVVPGAVATRSIWAPSPGSPPGAFETPHAVRIADGTSGALTWRLAATQGSDGTCFEAAVSGTGTSFGRVRSCSGTEPSTVVHLATQQIGSQVFVMGWADPRVARVVVDPGTGSAAQTARLVVAPRDRSEKAKIPAGSRAYVVTFTGDPVPRPRVTAFDTAGREIGALPPRR